MTPRRRRPSLGALDRQQWERVTGTTLPAVFVKRESGELPTNWRSVIPPLRPGRHVVVTDRSIIGDAPKSFVRVYEYESGGRDRPSRWPAYIAKVGHKWYPCESITEQLMTRLGQAMGLRMADSRLMRSGDQIRFMSRYFLREKESLVHGAEILEQHLGDEAFVDQVQEERLETELFTFSVLCTAVRAVFPDQAEAILNEFVRMIGFDAIVGNQDRHLYNWGVVVHAEGRRPPRFSPIFDTARGLFWNTSDQGLVKYRSDQSLATYVQRGCPLIGVDGTTEPNHFDLVDHVASCSEEYRSVLVELCGRQHLDRALGVLDSDFDRLLSKDRREAIGRCLDMRFRRVADRIGG